MAVRALISKLQSNGLGETKITQTTPDPTGGPARVDKATLALEPPDRARVDYAEGEALTVRSDGGEWLMPAAQQMLVLQPEQAAEAARVWSILLSGGEGFTGRKLGARRHALIPREAGGTVDSAWIDVDAAGLPVKAELFTSATGKVTVAFGPWKFSKARGQAAFRLKAPEGWPVIPLP